MKKQIKKTLSLARETVRTLQRIELEPVVGGFGTGTVAGGEANTCCGCQNTTGDDTGRGHHQQ
jgi:hypothetical protein